MKYLALALSLIGAPAFAQDGAQGTGAVLRALDRVSGDLFDIEMSNGQSATHGYLEISLSDCRYPADNPSSDAYAHVTISDARQGVELFDGWMVASSPALNALDHARFDVWVMRCIRD